MTKIKDEIIDELMEGCDDPAQLFGKNGLVNTLKAKMVERLMQAELDSELGYKKGQKKPQGKTNTRNGSSSKMVLSETGSMQIQVPRDRAGDFEPQVIKKHQRRLTGFNDQIVSLYARGMTTREIQGHLKEVYGTEVSKDLISRATEHILEEVAEFENRPLEPVYPIVYLDALVLKSRHQGRVQNRSLYSALGVTMEGKKDVLGLWMGGAEGPSFGSLWSVS